MARLEGLDRTIVACAPAPLEILFRPLSVRSDQHLDEQDRRGHREPGYDADDELGEPDHCLRIGVFYGHFFSGLSHPPFGSMSAPIRSGSELTGENDVKGLGRVKFLHFFCSERDHKPQNSGCGYTA
jgi:hypothetical protein